MCEGSVVVRPKRDLIRLQTVASRSWHSLWVGWAGSGLKFISELRRVLWMYAVVSLLRWRLVVDLRRSPTFRLIVALDGDVSPSMFSMVPKCLW